MTARALIPSLLCLLTLCLVTSCGSSSSRKVPVKQVEVQSSAPTVQAYGIEEAEITDVEVIGGVSGGEALIADSDPAADVLLGEAPDGTSVFLSGYANRVVLINYWASWCDQCPQYMRELQRIDTDYRPLGLVVVNVNYGETPQQVRNFLNSTVPGLALSQLVDPSGQATEAVGIVNVPGVIVFDRSGQEVVRYRDGLDTSRVRLDLDVLLK